MSSPSNCFDVVLRVLAVICVFLAGNAFAHAAALSMVGLLTAAGIAWSSAD